MAINVYENKEKYAFGLCAVIAIVLHFCFYRNTELTFKSIISVGGQAINITLIIVWIFDAWLWKYLPECLSDRPNLNGTWKGNLNYRWANPDSSNDVKDIVDPVYLVIKQKFLSVEILAFTKESVSHSLSTNISVAETGAWELSYMYDNTPELVLRQRSQRHRGAAELKVNKVNGQYHLKGDYWTDRWSQGALTFLERKKEFATDYYSASQIFETSSCS